MGGERYTTGVIRDGGDGGNGRRVGGEPALLAESDIAERFWERIRIFATRRLRDPAAAEDVAQETLRRVLDALRAGGVDDVAALPGFVFQTARHICLHRQRSAIREERALSRWTQRDQSAEPDALVALISEERCAAVRRALEGLEEDDRTLLRVIFFERQETAHVADQMGVSAGALRVRKHRALLRLSELLRSRDQ